jgi:hypothetical protein
MLKRVKILTDLKMYHILIYFIVNSYWVVVKLLLFLFINTVDHMNSLYSIALSFLNHCFFGLSLLFSFFSAIKWPVLSI